MKILLWISVLLWSFVKFTGGYLSSNMTSSAIPFRTNNWESPSGRLFAAFPFRMHAAPNCEIKIEKVMRRIETLNQKMDVLLLQVSLASFMLNSALANIYQNSIVVQVNPVITNTIDNGNSFSNLELDSQQRRTINVIDTKEDNLNPFVLTKVNHF
ncbi:hypothetical protein Avbf_05639 [Armadillidium vulgare]|nr:hypothetical protein Avbf_05639 [Armadillidium vulgare]